MPTVCELRDGTTTRPSLLTEADLVGLMDKNGIGQYKGHIREIHSPTGTDATIAEHIAKIIERKYVIEKPEGKSKYLVPSPLGIGLVEGYNQIGFDRSLSKPHLRAEVRCSGFQFLFSDAQTEHRMQLICDGRSNKVEVLDATIEEYKEVYMKAKRDFATVLEVSTICCAMDVLNSLRLVCPQLYAWAGSSSGGCPGRCERRQGRQRDSRSPRWTRCGWQGAS